MRAVVLGGGAVGQWLGALLARSGADTVLVVRPAQLPAVASGVLTPEGLVPLRAVADLGELGEEHQRCDWLALTVKAFDVEAALADATRAGITPKRVLTVQNGIGTDEAVADAFGAECTFVGSVTRAVGLDPARGILPASRGGLALAPMRPGFDPGDLLDRLGGADLPTALHDDWQAMKWSKLLLNLVANATCAILDELPGSVLSRYPLYALEILALREAVRAMRRLCLAPVDLPGYPVRLLARAARSLPTWTSFPVGATMMARGRGDKPPSLLLDLRAGRRRTEAPYLNGAVARTAAAAPVNRFLARTVQGLAEGTIPRERFRHDPGALLAALRKESRRGRVD